MSQSPFVLADASSTPDRPKEDLSFRLVCPYCHTIPPNLVEEYSAGDIVCRDCGLVLADRIIDTRSEWRTFANSDDNNDDPSRVGGVSDELLNGPGHIDGTLIAKNDGHTGMSKSLLRAYAAASDQKTEKRLSQGMKEVQALGDRLGLSKVIVDSAKQYFKQVFDDGSLKTKSPDAIVTGCILIACRLHRVGRTLKEMVVVSGVSKKDLGRVLKTLKSYAIKEDETTASVAQTEQMSHASMDSYAKRFGIQLHLSADATRATGALAYYALEIGVLAGKSPVTIIAAALYFVMQLLSDSEIRATNPDNKIPEKMVVSSKRIADVAGCNESTLKSGYRALYDGRERLKDIPEIKLLAKSVDHVKEV